MPPRTPRPPGSGRRCWPAFPRKRLAQLRGRFRGNARGQGRARALLADLLDWHRREDKPAWWRYFYLRTLSPAELIGEPDALGGLTGGDVVGQVKKSVVRRFRFPPQEHKFSAGGTACDPDTDKQWSICDVDDARGTIDLKIGQHLLRAVARGPGRGRGRPGPRSTGSAARSR